MLDRRLSWVALCFAGSVLMAGCLTVPSAAQRLAKADTIGEQAGFKRALLLMEPFQLTVYKKIQKPGQPLHVYIEGDGYAWVTRTRISGDPTPREPLALELAALDPAPNVVYIARPCQYTSLDTSYACDEAYWTGMRFAEEVINSMNGAVEWIVQENKIPSVDLIGYSGGASVAALIAARRDDVTSLRSVAGNLDPFGFSDYHHVSEPDPGTLTPMAVTENLADVPQMHFVGENDRIVPESIVAGYIAQLSPSTCARLEVIPGADHAKGWTEVWLELLKRPLSCAADTLKK